MIEVKKAAPMDFERLRPLMVEWIAECNPDGLRFDPDPDILVETFSRMGALPNAATFVLLRAGEPIGVLGLVQHNWGACKTPNFAQENMWYVSRRYAAYASKLVDAAKRWAREQGCDYLMFSTNRLAAERADTGGEFLAAMGFRPLYGLHLMEVDHV